MQRTEMTILQAKAAADKLYPELFLLFAKFLQLWKSLEVFPIKPHTIWRVQLLIHSIQLFMQVKWALASADRANLLIYTNMRRSTHLILECDLSILYRASLAHLQSYIASEMLQRGLHMTFRIGILCETIAKRLHQVRMGNPSITSSRFNS